MRERKEREEKMEERKENQCNRESKLCVNEVRLKIEIHREKSLLVREWKRERERERESGLKRTQMDETCRSVQPTSDTFHFQERKENSVKRTWKNRKRERERIKDWKRGRERERGRACKILFPSLLPISSSFYRYYVHCLIQRTFFCFPLWNWWWRGRGGGFNLCPKVNQSFCVKVQRFLLCYKGRSNRQERLTLLSSLLFSSLSPRLPLSLSLFSSSSSSFFWRGERKK